MIKNLLISSENLELIYHHAKQTYPEECCGLLVGKIEQNQKVIVKVIPTENNWVNDANLFANFTQYSSQERSKRDSFSIAPKTLIQVQKEARKLNLDIIGIYHSHPDHPAIPSEFDREIAWETYSYIIVSVMKGEIEELKSWSLNDHKGWSLEVV
jgi:proteasome lid subunit RPN8/RPN11